MLGEGKRIQLRREVANAPRVGVVTPRSSRRGRFFEDDEVSSPRLHEFRGRANSAKSGTKNDDVDASLIVRHATHFARIPQARGALVFEIARHRRLWDFPISMGCDVSEKSGKVARR
jgi:hypothetical protein